MLPQRSRRIVPSRPMTMLRGISPGVAKSALSERSLSRAVCADRVGHRVAPSPCTNSSTRFKSASMQMGMNMKSSRSRNFAAIDGKYSSCNSLRQLPHQNAQNVTRQQRPFVERFSPVATMRSDRSGALSPVRSFISSSATCRLAASTAACNSSISAAVRSRIRIAPGCEVVSRRWVRGNRHSSMIDVSLSKRAGSHFKLSGSDRQTLRTPPAGRRSSVWAAQRMLPCKSSRPTAG